MKMLLFAFVDCISERGYDQVIADISRAREVDVAIQIWHLG